MNVLHFSEIAAARTGPHRPPPLPRPSRGGGGAVRANEAALYPRPPPLSTPFRKKFRPPFFPLFPLFFRSFRPRHPAPAKIFSPSRTAVPTLFPACPPSPSPSSPGKEQVVRRDAEESDHVSRLFQGMEPCFAHFSTEWNHVSASFPWNGTMFLRVFHGMEPCFVPVLPVPCPPASGLLHSPPANA